VKSILNKVAARHPEDTGRGRKNHDLEGSKDKRLNKKALLLNIYPFSLSPEGRRKNNIRAFTCSLCI
jgi:hypothetical protein